MKLDQNIYEKIVISYKEITRCFSSAIRSKDLVWHENWQIQSQFNIPILPSSVNYLSASKLKYFRVLKDLAIRIYYGL